MNKIHKILFPTDFSPTAQNAFHHCLLLAKEMNASIILLHVIYPEYEAMDLPVMAAKATKDKVEAARLTLKSFLDFGIGTVQEHHQVQSLPEVKLEVEVGGAVGVITNIARRDEIDLIVMGTQGEHSAVERVFGSVTTDVAERAHCPVLVIPEQAPYHRFHIAAYATDLKEAEPDQLWRAGNVLEAFSPVLHIVHIDDGKQHAGVASHPEMEAFFEERAPALQVRFHNIPADSVEEGLEEFVENHDVDLLIMYAPQHNLLERIFQRSRVRRMAHKTHVPLLLLKTS
jgi:nucleotide-binding universal stress UspA family protein